MMVMMWLVVLKCVLNKQLVDCEAHENEEKVFRFMGGVHDLTSNSCTSKCIFHSQSYKKHVQPLVVSSHLTHG